MGDQTPDDPLGRRPPKEEPKLLDMEEKEEEEVKKKTALLEFKDEQAAEGMLTANASVMTIRYFRCDGNRGMSVCTTAIHSNRSNMMGETQKVSSKQELQDKTRLQNPKSSNKCSGLPAGPLGEAYNRLSSYEFVPLFKTLEFAHCSRELRYHLSIFVFPS